MVKLITIMKREYHHNYYLKNKEKYTQRHKTPEARKVQLEYRKRNRESARLRTKKWRENNHDYVIKRNNEYKKIKRLTNKEFNLRSRLSILLRSIFRRYVKCNKHTEVNDYSIDYKAVIEHLKPFPEDISRYHIDHIRPLCSFHFVNEDGSTNFEEVKKAFSPENHQWLLAEENIRKGGKWKG